LLRKQVHESIRCLADCEIGWLGHTSKDLNTLKCLSKPQVYTETSDVVGKDCPICPKYKSITANYILESCICTAFNDTSLSNFMLSESVKFIYSSILLFDEAIF
jgi:hypothetical protein